MTIQKHIFNKNVKRDIIHTYRDFATQKMRSTSKMDHIVFAKTIINGKRQNATEFQTFIQNRLLLPNWITVDTVRNLLRRAISNSLEAASIEANNMFNSWLDIPRSNLSTTNLTAIACRSSYEDVKQPTAPKQSGIMAQQNKTSATKKAEVIKVPVTTAEKIQAAITQTKFTATELLTKKFTVIEFLDRIGVEIK